MCIPSFPGFSPTLWSHNVQLKVCLGMRLCICLPFLFLTVSSVSVHLSVYPSVHPSACLSVCLSICLPVCLSVCPSVCPSVCLSACLSICLPVCRLSSLQAPEVLKDKKYHSSVSKEVGQGTVKDRGRRMREVVSDPSLSFCSQYPLMLQCTSV